MTDTDYEQGSLETANAILAFLRRKGHGSAANDVLMAWEGDTLVEVQKMPAPLPAGLMRQAAKSQGYTGDQCVRCNSMRMKVDGHCSVCEDCGTTTGCS